MDECNFRKKKKKKKKNDVLGAFTVFTPCYTEVGNLTNKMSRHCSNYDKRRTAARYMGTYEVQVICLDLVLCIPLENTHKVN